MPSFAGVTKTRLQPPHFQTHPAWILGIRHSGWKPTSPGHFSTWRNWTEIGGRIKQNQVESGRISECGSFSEAKAAYVSRIWNLCWICRTVMCTMITRHDTESKCLALLLGTVDIMFTAPPQFRVMLPTLLYILCSSICRLHHAAKQS